MNYEKAVKNIREELKTYIQEHNIKSLVIGISGGMDSCLCAALARPVCNELNIPLIGRSLPCNTNAPDEIKRARLTGKVFCTDFAEIDIFNYYITLQDGIVGQISPISDPEKEKHWKIRNGNIKARTRMILLYDLASKYHGMVLSTDNYTELMLGFWTLHGDVGDYGMIQNLWKTEVYDMAEWISINECKFLDEQSAIASTIEAMATDGLGVSSLGDLGQILPEWKGNSRDGYAEVDKILKRYLGMPVSYEKQAMEIGNPVIQRHVATHYKRNNPINIDRNIFFDGR